MKKTFFKKLFSVVNIASLVLQLVSPLFIFSPTPAFASSLESKLSWDTSKNSFNFSVNSPETVDYILAYQTNDKTEAVTGSGKDNSGNFSREIYAGTCSTGGTCVPHNVLRGILKVKIGDTVDAKLFTISNGNLDVIKSGTDKDLNLSNEETSWLKTPTFDNLGKINFIPSDSSPAPPPTQSTPSAALTTYTPSTVAVAGEQAFLSTTILKHTSAPSLDLDSTTGVSSASLSTDKADYAPTDAVVITGTNFSSDTAYTLTITSSDPPAVNLSTQITTNPQGSFVYTYQLDGNYRSNYKVEVKDLNGEIVATVTFTDGGAKIDKLYNDAGLTSEDYVFAVGNSVYVKATNLNTSRGYKLEAKNAAGMSVYTGSCKTGSTSVSDSYTPTTISGTTDWTWVLHEWTSSTCASGAQSEDADNTQAFNVAQATAYKSSSLGTSTTSYATGATAYVVVNGLQRSKNDWSVTWVKPDASNACQNTGGADRPDSTSAGVLPDTSPNYLEYPANTGTNNWNDPSKYDESCPAFASGNTGAWLLKLIQDSTHTVTLPVFSVTLADTTAPTAAITYSKNPVKSGDSLTISATFSEAMANSPVPKIAISGPNTIAATDMTKTDTTHYFYTYTAGSGDGTAIVALSTGTDLAGNVVTPTSTSGATFTVDNTAPTLTITGGPSGTVNSTSATFTFTADEEVSMFGCQINNGGFELCGSGTSGSKSYSGLGQGSYTFDVEAFDMVGNQDKYKNASRSWTIDNLPPTVTNVTSITNNGSYTIGKNVNVNVVFSEAVNVSGLPQILLETGTTDRYATYVSGNGTDTLSFTYSVVSGDTSTDLDYESATALDLNGGSIKDVANNDASLILSNPGAAGSLGANKAIVINTASAILLDSSLNPSTYGQSTTFTAAVTGSGDTPTGTIIFKDGVNTLDTETLSGSGTSATATYSTSALSAGDHSITAEYSDGNYDNGISSPLTQTVNQKTLTVPGITAGSKTYDSNTTAILDTTTATLFGVVAGDEAKVTLNTGSAIDTFADKNVGTGKTVTVSGLTISGASADNYTLTQPTITADITAKTLIVSATGVDKVYDGNTTATVNLSDDRVVGDVFTASYISAAFGTPAVGTSKTVSVSGISLSGTDADNYVLASASVDSIAAISKRNVTVTAVNDTKPYDGNAASAGVPTITAGALVSGDIVTWTQTFNNKNVGTDKTLTPAGTVSDGNGGTNYNVTFIPISTGEITAISALTISGITANDKIYDGNNIAALNTTNAILVGIISGDVVSLDTSNAAGAFSNKNVDTGKTVTISGLILGGADAGNYTLTQPTTTANITVLPITGSITVGNKVYDGDNTAVITNRTLSGEIFGDDIVYVGGSATFDTKNVGTDKVVAATGLGLSGIDAGNYSVNTTAATTANITAKSLAVSATADNKVYDGNVNATATLSDDRITGDVFSSSYTAASFINKNVGTGKQVNVTGISLSGADADNYIFNTSAATTADITSKSITVTADSDQTKVYGTSNPALTYTSDSLIEGDSLTGSLGRVSGETVGSYAITQGTLTAGDNYTITFVPADFNITTRAISVTANSQNKNFGDPDPVLTYAVTSGSLVGEDSFTGALARAAGEAVGVYAITKNTLALSENYTLTFISGTLTIVDNTAPSEPSASPVAGDYFIDQSVTLSSTDSGSGLAAIYYTTNEATPSAASTKYTAPINVDKDMTIKAIAYDNANNSSLILSAVYGIAPKISSEASASVTSSSVTITWTTDDLSTSRVVYDTVSHEPKGVDSNYGYANSTVEDSRKVTSHSVGLTGLSSGTTYYYRTISHGSPEAVGSEKSFTTNTTLASNNSNSSSGGDGGSTSAPTCNDTKPGSAPILTSALSGTSAVTLFWTAASDPVTYYLVTYGTSSGAQTYGNPNVGPKGTTSYTIAGLSGGATYYFKVRAGNGCKPGDFSNELSAAPTGGFLAIPATGFAQGVLGTQTQEASEAGTVLGNEATSPAELAELPGSNKEVKGASSNNLNWFVIPAILALLLLAFIFYRRRRQNEPPLSSE